MKYAKMRTCRLMNNLKGLERRGTLMERGLS